MIPRGLWTKSRPLAASLGTLKRNNIVQYWMIYFCSYYLLTELSSKNVADPDHFIVHWSRKLLVSENNIPIYNQHLLWLFTHNCIHTHPPFCFPKQMKINLQLGLKWLNRLHFQITLSDGWLSFICAWETVISRSEMRTCMHLF